MSALKTVMIVGRNGAAVADALASARWPDGGPATTLVVHERPSSVFASALANPSLFLIIDDDQCDTDALRALLEYAKVEGVPVLLLAPDERSAPSARSVSDAPTALRFSCDTTPGALAAAIAGLLVRNDELDQLSAELALSARVADGVRSEITRIDEELQMAAVLQQEFLPRLPPPIEGVEFAALWRPAGSVSGDVYDIIRLDERHIGVFLADAVGHGVAAALMAMQLCRALETCDNHDRFRRIVPPAEALSRLNALMADRQGRVGRYASATYAVIDCRDRIARLATAGGPAPIVVSHSSGLRALSASGPLLGMTPDQEFEELVIELADEDQLLIYSDGFEQAFRDDDGVLLFPEMLPRYLSEIARIRESSDCAAALAALANKLDIEQGSLHPADDCTLLLMRARAKACARAA
ncbi:MAG: PP2C family protein-serine/threonine phosphatase [Phycisphaerae bacterium]|nr:PP2C family protein-serine/threonine phosphatase [Phycisphaerae bacterium]